MFEPLVRDGLARCGVYRGGNVYFRTPACPWSLESVLHPLGLTPVEVAPHPLISGADEALEDFGDVVLVRNITMWVERSDDFIRNYVKKRVEEPEKIFILSGVRDAHVPLSIYLGADVIVPVYSYALRARGLTDTETGITACTAGDVGNLAEMLFRRSLHHLLCGSLREYVEGIPDITSRRVLRFMDHHLYSYLESVFPVRRDVLRVSGAEGLFRPEVMRYIERLETRYSPPEKDALILLPCSAHKPYSLSRTHRILRGILGLPRAGLQELIVTSPLGIVPRELESTFPANAYDIPVIGIWTEEEKQRIKRMVSRYLERGEYENLYAVLPEDLKWMEDFLEKLGFDYIFYRHLSEVGDTEISQRIRRGHRREKQSDYLRETMKSVIAYEFDIRLEGSVNVRRVGRTDDLAVMYGGQQIMTYRYHKGVPYLTRKGAELFIRRGKYIVEIHDFHLKGDLFVAGIVDVSAEIRPGDYVVLHTGGKPKGTGIALLPGHEMTRFTRGMAVRVRKRF